MQTQQKLNTAQNLDLDSTEHELINQLPQPFYKTELMQQPKWNGFTEPNWTTNTNSDSKTEKQMAQDSRTRRISSQKSTNETRWNHWTQQRQQTTQLNDSNNEPMNSANSAKLGKITTRRLQLNNNSTTHFRWPKLRQSDSDTTKLVLLGSNEMLEMWRGQWWLCGGWCDGWWREDWWKQFETQQFAAMKIEEAGRRGSRDIEG